jgi:hypothetical protein
MNNMFLGISIYSIVTPLIFCFLQSLRAISDGFAIFVGILLCIIVCFIVFRKEKQ